MAKRILITNIVTLNPGDAAILQGMIKLLHGKYGDNSEITVFDRNASAAQKYYSWAKFRQCLFNPAKNRGLSEKITAIGYGHWLVRLRYIQIRILLFLLRSHLSFLGKLIANTADIESVKQYFVADLIISTGGTYLIENYDLTVCRYDYSLSLICNAKFGFFTQTLGPFKKDINVKHFSDIFRRANFIFLRDEKSRQHVLDLDVPVSKIHLAADAAFALWKKKECHKRQSNDSANTIRVAVSVRSMNFFHREKVVQYYQSIAKAVEYLVQEHGAEVSFLSTCQGVKEYWTNDTEIAYIIYDLLSHKVKKKVIIDKIFREPEKIMSTYSTFDLVIATRMHAAILAICAGTPTIGIAYEFKIIELFKSLGLEELVLTVDKLSGTILETKIKEVLNNIEIYQKKVFFKAECLSASACSVKTYLPNL